jgi:hypothetical protein
VVAAGPMTEAGGTNNAFSDVTSADNRDGLWRDRAGVEVYYLVCLCCRSRLEVSAGLAGQACKCPTCGVGFVVPEVSRLQGSLGDPVAVGEVLEERVAPHAYAAAGGMAPEVVEDNSGKAMVRCRRCGTMGEIDANACTSCGIPFTIEAGTVEPAIPVDGWAIASVVLGVLSLAAGYHPGLAAAAVVTGLVALRRLRVQYGGLQGVAAWSGMALGGLSTALYVADVIRRD